MAVLLSAGCAHATLSVTPPSPSGQVQQLCAHLGDQLPATLASLRSRVVNPRSPLTHAWGSPPVLLRCGVPAPVGYSSTSSSTTAVNGVRWFQVLGPGAVIWTAIRPGPTPHTSVFVELLVPMSYRSQDGMLVQLAAPLKAALP